MTQGGPGNRHVDPPGLHVHRGLPVQRARLRHRDRARADRDRRALLAPLRRATARRSGMSVSAASPTSVRAAARARSAGELGRSATRACRPAASSNALLGLLGIAFLLPLIWMVFAVARRARRAGAARPEPVARATTSAMPTRDAPAAALQQPVPGRRLDDRHDRAAACSPRTRCRAGTSRSSARSCSSILFAERPAGDDAARPRLPDVTCSSTG